MECCHTGKHEEKGCCKDLEKQGIQKMEENGKPKKSKVWVLFAGVIVIFLLVLFLTRSSGASGFATIDSIDGEIDIYKSLTCGCCSVYTSYVDGKVSPRVNSFNVQDPTEIKNRYGIPSALESCHTTIIGDYYVEGHVPLEAVEKLLKEQPDIAGIAMPGMPEGSPGMPGSKRGDFVIYAVNNDGSYSEFMRI